jgi:superfamily II DNA or RNA helicase
VARYGHVIVDECHHVPAVPFKRVLSEVKARYVVGLTATQHRRDGHDPILEMQLGPVRFAVDPKSQGARRPFEQKLLVRETAFQLDGAAGAIGVQEIYRALATDEARNRMILDDVIRAVEDGRSPILLTERRDHLEYFAERLQSFARHVIVLHGGMTPKQRRELGAGLAELPDDEERLVPGDRALHRRGFRRCPARHVVLGDADFVEGDALTEGKMYTWPAAVRRR